MALGTFIAGRYAGSYDPPGGTAAADVGIMERGFNLEWQYHAEEINESDAYGQSLIDLVHRGGSVFLSGNAMEWKNGLLQMLTPWAPLAATGVTFLGPGVVARLGSAVAGILILTATAGTPAATSPASMTVTFAIASPQNQQANLDSRLRRSPWRLAALLYDDAGVLKWLTAA